MSLHGLQYSKPMLTMSVAATQNVERAIRKLENTIADRAISLFYQAGAIISVDDWKWLCKAADLPFKSRTPNGLGWPAENAATLPHKFVLASRKRVRDKTTGRLQSCNSTMVELLQLISQHPHGSTSVTSDRGCTTYDLANKGASMCCCAR